MSAQCINDVYHFLLERYGPQGWWPLISVPGTNPTKSGAIQGYHPGDFSFPRNENQRFEICVGAILTQNTNWLNVEKALINLQEKNNLSCQSLLSLADQVLCELIKPSGYYNQKAKKLRVFAEYYCKQNGATPTRADLLSLWGIGPETADSILLYAYQQPYFVVDAYTRRLFTSLSIIDDNENYESIRQRFESALVKDWRVYQEYHALIVEHAKHYYSKKPWGQGCPVAAAV